MPCHIVCDPVHGIMKFDEDIKQIIKPIVDNKYFQRLRHIKQLSFAEYAYPGAVHTRFNHCVGASYLAQCVAKALEFDQPQIIDAVVTALVHDVGHGPFSHAFEGLYGPDRKVHHESWNVKFIEAISEIVKPNIRRHLKKAKYILSTKESDMRESDDKLLKQIVSSQLDVDRFDYLLRDSHFSGVSYGHFDVQWLISCMRRNDEKITIEPKGVRSLEHYLMARRLMNLNVYFHKKKCAAEYLLKVLFEMCEEKLEYLQENINSPFLDYVDKVKKYKNKKTFELDMLNNCFDIYYQLTDHTVWEVIARMQDVSNKNFKEISNRFLNRDLPVTLQVESGKGDYVKNEIDGMRSGCKEKWRICFERPQSSLYKTKAEEIFVSDHHAKNGKSEIIPYINVLEFSPILTAFADKSENFEFLYIIDNQSNSKDMHNIKLLLKKLKNEKCLIVSKIM